ncbi:MAG: hypothetical protein E7641_06015 [Ruminococcaceae bacterium]|nr:hypothetical protein [Oscillospiraceae bacterium]
MYFGEERSIDFGKRKILDYRVPMDYSVMMQYLNELSARYPFLGIGSLGESIMGRSIPVVTVGEGKKAVLYVGAHSAGDWITAILLLRYINEYCEIFSRGGGIYNLSSEYIFKNRTVYIVPMLNPDGVDYRLNGVQRENPLYERVIRMNGGDDDLSLWESNARGVELKFNYNSQFPEHKRLEAERGIGDGASAGYSGNMPESEPEVVGLCNFLRFNEEIGAVISLHTKGERICLGHCDGTVPRAAEIGGRLSRITGYKLTEGDHGLCGWYMTEIGKPSFAIECGRGERSLSLVDEFGIYTALREMLFTVPTLI